MIGFMIDIDMEHHCMLRKQCFDNDRDSPCCMYFPILGILFGIGGHWVPLVLVHRRVVSRDMILGNLPPTTYNGFAVRKGGGGGGWEGIALMAVPPLSLLSLSFLLGYVSEDNSAFRPREWSG